MHSNARTERAARIVLVLIASWLVACDGADPADAGPRADGTAATLGDLTVVLESEDTIVDGLEPGTTGEAIQDGWAVTFEDYVVVIGAVDVHLSIDESVSRQAPATFAVDLTTVPESGLALWSLDGLQTGSWELNYAVRGAADGASRHGSVTEAQMTELVDGDLSYLVAGAMSASGGQSCPPASLADPGGATSNGATNAGGDACYDNPAITFRFGVQAETAYGPCEIDEIPGFTITSGAPTTVGLTIHGDHIFFNGFPEGTEGGVMRLAQWLADCDLDLDGEVTRAELEAIAPADLPEIDARFQLGGTPITPLTTMWDYVAAQLKTQGHFQGEGECPIDGTPHDH